MRDRAEVENRLRGLLCQELDRRLAEATRRLPHLCTHNHRQPLDHRKIVEGEPNPAYNRIAQKGLPVAQTLGLCMLSSKPVEGWQGDICEDPIDAKRCPYFTPRQTVQEVYDQFLSDLETRALSGEVLTLFWVLGEKRLRLPWWKKVWFAFWRVNYEPLQTPVRELTVDLLPPVDTLNEDHHA